MVPFVDALCGNWKLTIVPENLVMNEVVSVLDDRVVKTQILQAESVQENRLQRTMYLMNQPRGVCM